MSNFKSITDLKKGDKVAFYGATMEVTKDAYKSENFETPTYIAKCKLIDVGHSVHLDILTNYDYFQGTKEVNFLVINPQI